MVILFTSVSVKRADHYTRDPLHPKNGSHFPDITTKRTVSQTTEQKKFKISSSTRPFHSLLLSLFLRLVFGVNRGLWSNPHHPEAWTRELRKTDSGKVMANMAIDQQFHLDLCLLMPTFSVLLYWRKERQGSLSFEIEIQSLQFYACPEDWSPYFPGTVEFPLQKIGL